MTVLNPAASELIDLAAEGRTRPAIEFVLGLADDGAPVEEIITGVLAPVQIEVGERWESNRWGVAEEHAATAVIDGVLGALALHTTPLDRPRGTVLVACAAGEHHAMPARMGVELLRGAGWDVTFLGGSVPADDLQRYAGVTDPDIVVVSCTVPLYLSGARRCFAAVAELGLPAIAAGAAFGQSDLRWRRLGASGRIGPDTNLADLVALVETPEPLSSATPAEALAVEMEADALRRACLAAMTTRMPALAGYGPGALASTGTDVGDILRYLATSIDVGDDAIFADFVAWLDHVLEMRGVPSDFLDRMLAIIGEVTASAEMATAARLCGHRARAER